MPAYSRSKVRGKPNLVKERPPLPDGLVYSDITLNYSFQGFPAVSVKAEGLSETKFNAARRSHKLGTTVNLFGIEFEVSKFGWTKESFAYKYEIYATYSINVDYQPVIQRRLESGIKVKKLGGTYSFGVRTNRKIKTKQTKKKDPKISLQKLCDLIGVPYTGPEVLVKIPEDKEAEFNVNSLLGEAARSKGCFIEYGNGVQLIPWHAPKQGDAIAVGDVFVDGENYETFPPTYQGVELSWDRENEEPDDLNEDETNQEPDPDKEKNEIPPRYDFIRIQPVIQTITEQDENFDKPPPDTKVIKGMDSLFWQSGPTRKRTVTTLYDGSKLEEETEFWGFNYLVEDLHIKDGVLFTDAPELYWKKCEWNKTSNIYEPLGLVSVKVTGIDKAKKSVDQSVRLVLHPDYKNLGKISSFAGEGYMFSFQPKVEYLTKISSIGYKTMPLEKQPGKDQDLIDCLDPEENPRAHLQIPIAIPKADYTAYRLGSARSFYKEEEQNQTLPYQIEFKTFAELDPYVQDEVRWQIDLKPMGPNDLIGVVTPDLGYQEPMVVLTESRTTNSFMYAADPDSNDENPVPPLVTGEEGYFRLDRTILSKDEYREAITEYTATDPGYKSSLTIVRTAEKTGQAPQGESRQVKYDKKENADWWLKRSQYQYKIYGTPVKPKQERPLPRYFVNSDLQKEGMPNSGNLSFPYATSLEEATKAAKVALEMEHCQNAGQHSKSISWYFTNIRDGRRVTIGGMNFRVLSASVSLEQIGDGVLKPVSGFAQLTQGTKVTLGPDVGREIEVYQVKDDLDDNPMDDALNPDQGAVPKGDGEAKSTFLGGTTDLGGVLQPDSTRRKF